MSEHDVYEAHDDDDDDDQTQEQIEINDESVEHRDDNQTTNLHDDLSRELKSSLKLVVTHDPPDIGPTPYKVAVVGMNELGSATAFLLVCRQVATDVIIIDKNANRLAGRTISVHVKHRTTAGCQSIDVFSS
jgi:hypothetical protein